MKIKVEVRALSPKMCPIAHPEGCHVCDYNKHKPHAISRLEEDGTPITRAYVDCSKLDDMIAEGSIVLDDNKAITVDSRLGAETIEELKRSYLNQTPGFLPCPHADFIQCKRIGQHCKHCDIFLSMKKAGWA